MARRHLCRGDSRPGPRRVIRRAASRSWRSCALPAVSRR